MKVLIAEDDLSSRNLLSAMLRKAGYEVLETLDGEEVWKALQKPDAPKLVILDWLMPKMDGLEVLRRVRAIESDRPPYILMLTVKTAKTEIIEGLRAGANDYLTKPFDMGELRARLEVGRLMIETQDALAAKIEELHRALGEIKTLRGIVPICAGCKKIRDDQGYWKQVEVYLKEHTEAEFSHGLCPDCKKRLYSDLSGDADQIPPE
ncbi:response regulator [Desulfatirhabdium butyrativorans]|uniref:response regulator n=1 Tax=Desulfatirhabdium butyrativorans TaxID=340467 RepID=UPI0003F7F684|nr:response regulator transcription factor [Desulfatirhabdium butyrativorans]